MKKIILVLFILISVLMFSSSVSAQTTPSSINIKIPGFNCGYADDPDKNKCCIVSYPSSFIPPDVGPANILIDTFKFVSNNFKNNLWQPLIDTFKGITDKNISSCYVGVQSTKDSSDPGCVCNPVSITPSPGNLVAMNDFCQRQSNVDDRSACLACANDGGVFSGIGCVKTDAAKFIQETVFGLGVGLAGGFSLLCIIYAAFMMQSSQGNPEKLKKAQEMITSCIMGLMLIIFSVFILKLIGVNILRIKGFS